MTSEIKFIHSDPVKRTGASRWPERAPARLGAVTAMATLLFFSPLASSSEDPDSQPRASQPPASQPSVSQSLASQNIVPPRPREDYEPLGLHHGGFLILPSIEVRESYEDNLLRSESEAVDEFVTSIRPEVRAESQWSSHAMNFSAGADASRYAKNSDQNTTDYFFSADGRFDNSSRSSLSASTRVSRLHLQRGDPNTPQFISTPTEFFVSRAEIGGSHRFNRIALSLSGQFARFRYENGTNRQTGAVIIQDDRDRDHFDLVGRMTYEVVSDVDAFMRLSVNERDYEGLQGRGRFQRDAGGYEFAAGTELEIEDIISGELFAGYFHQGYEDSRLATTKDLIFGGSLLWNPTRLTSLNAVLSRTPNETTNQNASTIMSTSVGVLVEHQLLRNVKLTANARYINDDFLGIDREDHYYNFGIGGSYLINRHSSVRIGYNFTRRRSNNSSNNFDHNIFSLTLRFQM